MKKPIFSQPDAFSISPFLVLLPVKGSVGRLPSLTTPLYARYEKVQRQIKESEIRQDLALLPRLRAEEGMLKQVLDWVSVRREGAK